MGMTDGPYRRPADCVTDKERGTISFGPIFYTESSNGIKCVERWWTMDGWPVSERLSIWNAQRQEGEPSVAIRMNVVANKHQWEEYRKAVDELWEAWERRTSNWP